MDEIRLIDDALRVKDAPTIEAEPARRGVWVANTWCSACSRFPVDCSLPISSSELTKYFEYCPHCGAKMDMLDYCQDDDGSGVGQAFSPD